MENRVEMSPDFAPLRCTPSREKAEESTGVQRPMFGIRSFGDIGVALGVGKAL